MSPHAARIACTLTAVCIGGCSGSTAGSFASPERPAALEVRLFGGLKLGNASAVEEELDRPLADELEVRASEDVPFTKLRSCRALLSHGIDEAVLVNGYEQDYQVYWSTAVRCAALQLVQRVRPARASAFRELLASEAEVTHWLPPQLGMYLDPAVAAAAEAAAARCEPWAAFEPELRVVATEPKRVRVESATWSAELHYYALGDFDADGSEDLLLRRDAFATEGSYAESSLFLLAKREADRCVVVTRRVH